MLCTVAAAGTIVLDCTYYIANYDPYKKANSRLSSDGRTIINSLNHTTRPYCFTHPVVLESICYRTTAKRLINESNTTGYLEKIGREEDFFYDRCKSIIGVIVVHVPEEEPGEAETTRHKVPTYVLTTKLRTFCALDRDR